MRSPVGLNVVLVVVGATLFYTYVGQLVPQKELQPPPKVEITAEMTPQQLAKIGDSIAHDKGLCLTCHTVGKKAGRCASRTSAGVGRARQDAQCPGSIELQYFAADAVRSRTRSSSPASAPACRRSTSRRSGSPMRSCTR